MQRQPARAHTNRPVFLAVLIVCVVLNAGSLAEARTWTVYPGELISATILKAHPGDRIDVMPGIYHEGRPGDLNPLTITIDQITIVGRSLTNQPVVLENAGGQKFGVWVSPLDSTGGMAEANNEAPPARARVRRYMALQSKDLRSEASTSTGSTWRVSTVLRLTGTWQRTTGCMVSFQSRHVTAR